MIDLSLLPSWHEVYSRIGEHPPRRNRGRCPIHGGDSPYSVALDEDKGVFYCHVCHAGGDKITFVRQVLHCDFSSAVAALTGADPGQIDYRQFAPDLAIIRRRKIREGLRRWARILAKQLRFEHYVMERVMALALERLVLDPEDARAWSWLEWPYKKQEAISHQLDQLEGDEEQMLDAYRQMRRTAA